MRAGRDGERGEGGLTTVVSTWYNQVLRRRKITVTMQYNACVDKDELSGSGEELRGVRQTAAGGGKGQEGGEDRRGEGEGTEGLGGDSCRKGGSLMGL